MAESSILMRLDGLKIKYEELGQKLTDPEVIADVKAFIQFTKEYKELEPIIETSERFRKAIQALADAKDILANEKDEEFREMARMEISELEPAIEQMEEEIKLLLIPKDPQDGKNAVLEIRGGTISNTDAPTCTIAFSALPASSDLFSLQKSYSASI